MLVPKQDGSKRGACACVQPHHTHVPRKGVGRSGHKSSHAFGLSPTTTTLSCDKGRPVHSPVCGFITGAPSEAGGGGGGAAAAAPRSIRGFLAIDILAGDCGAVTLEIVIIRVCLIPVSLIESD